MSDNAHSYKLAIIGASYLQLPLIEKAKKRGIETHVFAWAAGDVGEKEADFFYPISITEKDEILDKCRQIGIDGICSIASDLAAVTVGYVASRMGLTGNPEEAVLRSTNKHLMRECFEQHGDPSPKSVMVGSADEIDADSFDYPVIVKPLDRSGSRGITKVYSPDELASAVDTALSVGFEKNALIEEYVTGSEYSVEYISWNGKHTFLALTKKYTTGSPTFIETGHLEPAPVDKDILLRVQDVVTHALDSLGIRYGASHSEVKISAAGDIKIIEIGGRMGGDNIGSSLVELSTGYPFVDAVIDVALGIEPAYAIKPRRAAGIRFVFSEEDVKVLSRVKKECPGILVEEDVRKITGDAVTDSSTRFGYFTLSSIDPEDVIRYMPEDENE